MAQKIKVPKGAKHGSVVTRGGKRYKVISYRKNGKTIRYLTPLAAMEKALAKARRASKKAAKTGRKSTGKKAAPKRTSKAKGNAGKVTIPKGKRVGQCFKKGNRCYLIATVPTAKGGKRRYARLITAATYAAKTGRKAPATKKRSTKKSATKRRSNPGRIYLAGIGYI